MRLSLPFEAHTCVAVGAIFEGNDGREGILVWVSDRLLDSAGYPIRAPSEPDSQRHARVAIRYVTGDVPHGFALDSGTVRLRDSAGVYGGEISGSGLELPGALRVRVTGVFRTSPHGADSVPCAYGGAP